MLSDGETSLGLGSLSLTLKSKFRPGRCIDCLLLCSLLSRNQRIVNIPKHRFVAVGKIKWTLDSISRAQNLFLGRRELDLPFSPSRANLRNHRRCSLLLFFAVFVIFRQSSERRRKKTNKNQTVVKLQLLRHVSTVRWRFLLVPCSLAGWIPTNFSRPRRNWNGNKIL